MNDGLSAFLVVGLVIWGIAKLHKHFGPDEESEPKHIKRHYRTRPVYRDYRHRYYEDEEDEENY